MTVLPPAPGAIDIVFSNIIRGRKVSFKVQYGDGTALEYTSGDLNSLGNALLGAWETASRGIKLLSNEMSVTTVELTDLFNNTAPRETLIGTSIGGTAVEALPLNVALVMQRTQDRRYRGGKSHPYIAGAPTNAVGADSDFWTTAFQVDMFDTFVDMDTAAFAVSSSHGHGFVPISVSYFDKHTVPAPPHLRANPVLFAVTGYVTQSRVCTRRRRLPKLT